jgi:hypothetical protein
LIPRSFLHNGDSLLHCGGSVLLSFSYGSYEKN